MELSVTDARINPVSNHLPITWIGHDTKPGIQGMTAHHPARFLARSINDLPRNYVISLHLRSNGTCSYGTFRNSTAIYPLSLKPEWFTSSVPNGRMRDELLNESLFFGLDHARQLIASWVEDYNTARPDSSLGYQTPKAFSSALRTARAITLCRGQAPRTGPLLLSRHTAYPLPRL